MTKLIESLHHLFLFKELINGYILELSRVKTDEKVENNSLFYMGIRAQILLYVDAFIVEWDKHLLSRCEPDKLEKIKELQTKANPAISRIRDWTGLRKYRNTVLAHGFRDKNANYDSVFLTGMVYELKIPEEISEILLVAKCIEISTTIIIQPFLSELENTKKSFYKSFSNRKHVSVDFEEEVRDILEKISKIK